MIALFQQGFGPLPRRATLGTLTDLLARLSPVPYENLTKIIVLDQHGGPHLRGPEVVISEHLQLGTGGTCFSLTELMRVLVTSAGFTAYPVMAHMRHGANIHCALIARVGGESYLLDPGYLVRRPLALAPSPGDKAVEGHGLGAPLLLPAGQREGAPPGVPAGDFDLFTLEPEGLRWRYRFSDRAPSPQEFEGHWRASFSQQSMGSLFASTSSADAGRVILHNHKLRCQGQQTKVNHNIRASMPGSVEQYFGIDPRITERAAAIIHKLREQRKRGCGQ